MFKRFLLILSSIMVLIFLLAGCSATPTAEVRASLGQEFILPIGQTVLINGENLNIKFEAVTADSRCPKGVTCIWAGEAKCQMQLTYNGSTSQVVYTESGGTDGFSKDLFNNYKVSFKLTPYPEAGKPIVSTDYKLLMTITK